MKAAIFTLDTGAYKARAESVAASALKRMLEQVGFEVRAAGILPQNREVWHRSSGNWQIPMQSD